MVHDGLASFVDGDEHGDIGSEGQVGEARRGADADGPVVCVHHAGECHCPSLATLHLVNVGLVEAGPRYK